MAQSYQEKYYFFFKDINNNQFTIRIHQLANDGTISTQQVTAGNNPFTVMLPSISNKFQSVRGTGCTINLLSQSNMQFLDLFTANMLEYKITAYKNGSLFWTGFLDSELYTEPFNELTNYEVSVSGSDGFAILSRMKYLDTNGNKYTGLDSQFNILKTILSKLDLDILNTYLYLSTIVTGGLIGVGQTLLNNTYVVNENFYDEDGEPMNCRQVLESILSTYGAFIIQCNGNYYITDIHALASGSLSPVLRYSGTLNSFISEVSISTLIGDISTIKMAASDANLNIISGINKQLVKYSPYWQSEIVNYDATTDFSTAGAVNTFGTYPYNWQETQYEDSVTFNKYNGGRFIKQQAIGGVVFSDYYLKIANTGHTSSRYTQTFGYKLKLPTFIASSNYFLKIKMKGYFRKTNDLGNPSYTPSVIDDALLFVGLQVGSKKFSNSTIDAWVPLASTEDFTIGFSNKPSGVYNNYTRTKIEDAWVESGGYKWTSTTTNEKNEVLVPLTGIAGEAFFNIYGYIPRINSNTYTTCLDARIKDIVFTIVDVNGEDVSGVDYEYTGYMNELYENEGNSLDLVLGTNTSNFPLERGGLIRYDLDSSSYRWIEQWTRASSTDSIEKLLLRSYVGNYENKTVELTATTNILSTYFGYLTYNNYFSGKKFMITAIENNYSEATSNITIQEIFTDSLTINSI